MVEFLFKVMFVTDLLVIGFALTAKMPKRDHFALRAATAVLAVILISVAWTTVSNEMDIENNMLSATINYVLMSTVAAAGIAFCVSYNGWSAIFVGASMWLVQHLATSVDQLLPISHPMSFGSWALHMGIILVCAVIAWLFFYRPVDAQVMDRIDLVKSVPSWVLMCVVCVLLSTFAGARGEGDNVSFELLTVVCCLILLLYQRSVYIICGVQREEYAISQVLRLSRHQYATTKEQMEMVNIKAHDLKHQIHAYRRNGQIDEKTLREMESAVDSYDTIVKTGNDVLDVMLTEKHASCLSRGITLTCMADGTGLNYMESGDLYALFGNALTNAIEATEKLEDPEMKQISFTMNRIGDMVSVCVMNYVANDVSVVNGIPQTTKKDKANHGFGMRSMQLIVEKYDGNFTFHLENRIAEVDILLPAREKSED